MLYLKVPRKDGEKVRLELILNKLFSQDYPILSEYDSILFPVSEGFGEYELVEREAERRPKNAGKLKDVLAGTLSPA